MGSYILKYILCNFKLKCKKRDLSIDEYFKIYLNVFATLPGLSKIDCEPEMEFLNDFISCKILIENHRIAVDQNKTRKDKTCAKTFSLVD